MWNGGVDYVHHFAGFRPNCWLPLPLQWILWLRVWIWSCLRNGTKDTLPSCCFLLSVTAMAIWRQRRWYNHQRSAMEWIAPGGEWLLLLLLLLPRVNNAIVDDTLRLIQTTTIIISDMQICSLYSSIFFVCSSLLSCSTIKMNVCTVWRLHTLN